MLLVGLATLIFSVWPDYQRASELQTHGVKADGHIMAGTSNYEYVVGSRHFTGTAPDSKSPQISITYLESKPFYSAPDPATNFDDSRRALISLGVWNALMFAALLGLVALRRRALSQSEPADV